MIVLLKNDKQILVICLIIQHKDNNKRSGKNSPNLLLTFTDHAYGWGQDEFSQGSWTFGQVREEFQMRDGEIGTRLTRLVM